MSPTVQRSPTPLIMNESYTTSNQMFNTNNLKSLLPRSQIRAAKQKEAINSIFARRGNSVVSRHNPNLLPTLHDPS